MKIGLFFGSFNPIHVGHVILANHILEFSTLENLWFVVTPQSPFKKKQSLISNYTRIEMVEMAIKNYPKMKSCNIEFSMKQPAYTVDTLAVLREKYPKHQFDLIMGEDNLVGFTKWKNYQEILENHDLWVYPRPGHLAKDFNHPNIHRIQAPVMEISSTYIRNCIKENKNFRPLLDPEVFKFLEGSSLYK